MKNIKISYETPDGKFEEVHNLETLGPLLEGKIVASIESIEVDWVELWKLQAALVR